MTKSSEGDSPSPYMPKPDAAPAFPPGSIRIRLALDVMTDGMWTPPDEGDDSGVLVAITPEHNDNHLPLHQRAHTRYLDALRRVGLDDHGDYILVPVGGREMYPGASSGARWNSMTREAGVRAGAAEQVAATAAEREELSDTITIVSAELDNILKFHRAGAVLPAKAALRRLHERIQSLLKDTEQSDD